MSNETELNDLDDHWEDSPEETATPHAEKSKPVENKDARRRLDDLLEKQRVKREIEDDF